MPGGPKSDGHEAVAVRQSPTKLLVEIVLVDLDVVLPLVGHGIFRKDRAHRTHGFTCTAVNAFIRMDEVHVVCIRCIYAVNRADI